MRITVFTRAEQRLAWRRFDRQAEFRRHQRLDTAVKSGTDRLPKIQHIVVLMMENHSYDNYFGMLKDRERDLSLGTMDSR